MLWKCFDGSDHPVSDQFLKIVPTELSGLPFNHIEAERLALLAKGNVQDFVAKMHEKPNAKLTPDRQTVADLSLLRACDYVINMNRSLVMLDGRDYRSHNEMFGLDGTLCQVHHNEWRPPCGCRLPFIFDHWLRDQPDKIVIYPHHWQIHRCSRHSSGDYSDVFFTVQRENRAESYAAMKALAA